MRKLIAILAVAIAFSAYSLKAKSQQLEINKSSQKNASQRFTEQQADSIIALAINTESPAFNVLINNLKELDKVKGGRAATGAAQFVIFKDIMEKEVNQEQKLPEWEVLKRRTWKYGDLGKETYWKAKYIYHLNRKEWPLFAKSFQEYFTYGKTEVYFLFTNNYAFEVFKNCADRKLLRYAESWMNYALTQVPSNDTAISALTDTKASLLYKLGEKDQAIALERTAIEFAKQNGVEAAEFENTLEEMLSNKF